MQARSSDLTSSDKRRIAKRILEYLNQNPHAMDTVQGITQWWVQEDAGIVGKAIALLLKGDIIRVKVIHGQHYYRLNEAYRGGSLSLATQWFEGELKRPSGKQKRGKRQ